MHTKKKVSLTLNNHYYTVEQEPLIKQYIYDCISAGVDSFIVADPTLIEYIREFSSSVGITISSEAGCYSGQDILFFAQSNVQRIIFPRDMTLQEMNAAIQFANLPNMEYEAFIYGPRCTYSGPYCTLTHGLINGPSFCSYKLMHSAFRTDGSALSFDERQKMQNLLQTRNQWACNNGDDTQACGICAIETLDKIGVHYLKVVGREYGLEENVRNIQRVEAAISNINNEKQKGNESCRKGLSCYYSFSDIESTKKLLDSEKPLRLTFSKKEKNECRIPEPLHRDTETPEISVLCTKKEEINIDHLSSCLEMYLKDGNIFSGKAIRRIYYGNEFCQKKIPSLHEVQNAIERCQKTDGILRFFSLL